MATSDKDAIFYLYGSEDGRSFKLVNGRGYTAGQIEYLILRRSFASYRYFAFVFAGNFDQSARIGSLEVDVEDRYVRKLR